VGVAQAIEHRDTVLSQDLASLAGGLVGDEEQVFPGAVLRIAHQLPRRGRICATLALHLQAGLLAGEADPGVYRPIGGRRLFDDSKARDLAKDAQPFGLEGAFYFHCFGLFHSSCEYSKISEKETAWLPALWPRSRESSPVNY